jgi:hypothetical protein
VEHEEQVGTTGTSSRVNKVVGRALYPVQTPRLTPPAAAGEKASEPETDPFGWDALISVWWDSPPCQDPTDGQCGERPS